MSTKVADNHRRVWKRLQRAGERGMTLTGLVTALGLSRSQIETVMRKFPDDYETTGETYWNGSYWRVKHKADA